MQTIMTRRQFLKGMMATGGLAVAVCATPFGLRIFKVSAEEPLPSRFSPVVWYQILPDDTVLIVLGNSEMGQGVYTAHSQILADELEADWAKIKVIHGGARDEYKNPLLGAQQTVASSSIRGFYEILRKAGAAGRAMLVKAAADLWKVPEGECIAQKGLVRHKKTGKTLRYGELVRKASQLPLPKDPPLKEERAFRYIGKSIPRIDVPDKVNGRATFGLDVEIPGMLYAVVARPPAYGAKLLAYDKAAAMAVRGVKAVVEIPTGIAVCADSLMAALKGREALQVRWSEGTIPTMDNAYIERSLIGDLEKPGAEVFRRGNVDQALREAEKTLEATYFVPYVAHCLMEPINCCAYYKGDRLEVWAPTQGQTVAQIVAAQVAGLPPEKVSIHTPFLGCGLGRRARPDFVAEAVVITKAIGKPIKLLWTREEDIKYDAFRAAMAHRIRAGVDAQGEIIAWSHKVVSGSILKEIDPKAIINGVDFMSLWGLADFPDSPHNNRIMYNPPHMYIEFLISDLPIPVFPWRSVQNGANAFVIEGFVDELAHLAGIDPLEFRLRNLRHNHRCTRVLEVVAEKSGWGTPLPAGMGRGVAQHSCFGTYVAQVAEVSVDKRTGKTRVHRVVAAVDCGPVVNPDIIVAQIEGAICLSISTALKEEVVFEKGGVKSSNFDDYPTLRLSEVPEIEVHIVESRDRMGGIGEPGVPPGAPAVVNAIFAASGARLRRIPATPERVLHALKGG